MKALVKVLLILILVLVLVVITVPLNVIAQEGGGDDVRSKAQNPVSAMYSLPLKFSVDFGHPLRTNSLQLQTSCRRRNEASS